MPYKPDLIKLMDKLNNQIDAAAEWSENSQWEEVAAKAAEIEKVARLLQKHYPTHASRMEYYQTHRGDVSVSNVQAHLRVGEEKL